MAHLVLARIPSNRPSSSSKNSKLSMPSTKRNARGSRLRKRCAYMRPFSSCRRNVCPFDRRTPSAQSNLTNKSRLRLLHRREEHVQELFETARSQIVPFAEDEARYSQFLEGAIVQGLLQLMEPHVTLIVREKDVEQVQKAAEAAAETYNQLSGRQVAVDIQGLLSDDGYVSDSF